MHCYVVLVMLHVLKLCDTGLKHITFGAFGAHHDKAMQLSKYK